ncbi:MAG: choice-of-anchor B family protein, partial [Acidimicrobiia bacterium]|nr:choice-of-anchor B family protein [Acidimicrobiia bacterium]
YTHDAQCVTYSGPDADYQGREICFNSNEDTLTVFDMTDLVNGTGPAVMLSRETYPGASYTHQGWLTADQSRFVLGDETDELDSVTGADPHNTYTFIWDVEDLNAVSLINTYVGPSGAIDHNIYIKDGFVYEANYTEGLRILDAANIETGDLTEVAYFDTHPSDNSTVYAGAWSSYPFFESGTIVVSNIEDGLFVLQARLPGVEEPVEPTGGGKVTGGGWLATDGKKLNFGFNAKTKDDGFDGNLTLNDKSADVKIKLETVTAIGGLTGSCGSIEPGANAIEFRGSGTFNGDAASFRVCAEDNGEGNNASAADQFVLSCLEGCDYHTSVRALDDEVDGGNIQLHEAAEASGSADSGDAGASVVILDPMLTTESPIGAVQVLDVQVFDASGAVLSGVSVQLVAVDTTGTTTTLSAITDATGIAGFTAVTIAGDTEYIAVVDGVSSNAIDITGLS